MNKFLPFFLFLIGYIGQAQVGIGTLVPELAAQLEIAASDKGILIPRIALATHSDTLNCYHQIEIYIQG